MTVTAEELDTLPVDSVINVTGVSSGAGVWTRVDSGFSNGVATVPPGVLRGLARLGQIAMSHPADRVQVGSCSLSTSGRWRYVALEPVDDGWRFGAWRDNAWYGWIDQTKDAIGGWTWEENLEPAFVSLMQSLQVQQAESVSLRQQRDEMARLRNEALEHVRQATERLEQQTVAPGLVSDLHGYAEELDAGDFDDLLARHGIGRSLDHEIAVTLTGTIRVPMDRDTVDLGWEWDIEGTEDGRIEWYRNINLTRSGVGCTCDEVRREDVAEFVPDRADSDWSFSVECD